MSSILSIYSTDGVWYATVLKGGSTTAFEFESATDVILFQILMARNDAATLTSTIGKIFKWNFGLEPNQIFNYLFVNTDAMIVDNSAFISALEIGDAGGDIAALLVQFGEFLGAALGMAALLKKKTRAHHLSAVHNIPVEKLDRGLAVQPDYDQKWLNFSKDSFKLVSWSCNVDQLLGHIIQQPSKVLDASGAEELSWTQAWSGVYTENVQGSIQWVSPAGNVFGVLIDVRRKAGGYGRQPYYQVWDSDSGKWEGTYTSEPYTFPETIGYKVQVRPISGPSNIFLTIVITDLKPQHKVVSDGGSKKS